MMTDKEIKKAERVIYKLTPILVQRWIALVAKDSPHLTKKLNPLSIAKWIDALFFLLSDGEMRGAGNQKWFKNMMKGDL